MSAYACLGLSWQQKAGGRGLGLVFNPFVALSEPRPLQSSFVGVPSLPSRVCVKLCLLGSAVVIVDYSYHLTIDLVTTYLAHATYNSIP